MVLAEAMIARATGAVTKFKLGKLGVGSAADGAFVRVEIGLLLAADARGFAAEVDGVLAWALGQGGNYIPAAENEEVDHRDDGQEVGREARRKDAENEKRGVDIGEIFNLDGNDVKKQHLHVREKHREREEHGKVNILGGEVEGHAGGKVNDKAVNHREDKAGEKVNIELRRAPIALKRGADHIIKIKRDEGEQPRGGRVEREGDKPPHLTAQNERGVEREIAHQNGVHRAQHPKDDVGNGDIFHQIRDAEVGVAAAKALYPITGSSHL